MAQIKLLGKTNIQGKTIFATEKTYTISSSVASVNEGSSVTFTLTTNEDDGTVLPYTITGISSGDLSSGSLTGTFIVSNGSATTSITLQNDVLTEGAETATITLNNGAASTSVLINDTSTIDSDALTYINAVEAADGQALELAVRSAINGFVVGCKSDGIWTALKASCILAGARTLNGALVPLVGTAPTNFNFVSGDYNRKTGLVGNGTSKYLNTNRNNNADPQNNQHLSVYSTNASAGYFLASFVTSIGTSGLINVSNTLRAYSRSTMSSGSGFTPISNQGTTLGFKGITRNSSSAFSIRSGATTTSGNTNSASPDSNSIIILARSNGSGGAAGFSSGRLSFYSIGEHLNLSLLDTRVSALMTAINAAI